jgi:hypothetical protein
MRSRNRLFSSLVILCSCFFFCECNNPHNSSLQEIQISYKEVNTDSLPSVLTKNSGDLIKSRLKNEAALRFGAHHLPNNMKDWKEYRRELREKIIQKAGVIIDPKLPLNIKETGTIQMKGYTIKKIAFQTRPGVYTTANLYVPDGEGPFPAVISMHGHWDNGRVHEVPQARGHLLALNGYVCLSVDAFGSGERTTIHGVDEYHGANLGGSLLNVGESLIGVQISDNIKGVDLLSSLSYVDSDNIGATGASGGGNQTMWLAAIDERVKAAIPVVSVGTFESYVMGSNCICETMTDGLTLSEEAGVLALVAPRALEIYNVRKDNPAFSPSEMLRSYNNAKPIFEMYGVGTNIRNQIFDLSHGYHPEMREAMLGWFDFHLKGVGTGEPVKEVPFDLLPQEKLMVFSKGERDSSVLTIEAYTNRRGHDLRGKFLSNTTFDIGQKKKELANILRIGEKSELKKVHRYSRSGEWNRFALETSDNKLIPLLHHPPTGDSKEYIIVSNPEGKDDIPSDILKTMVKSGSGIVVVDLSGTGEALSFSSNNRSRKLHTVSRAELWLGKSTLGEWVKELNVVIEFLNSRYEVEKISVDGSKEAGLAGLFLSATLGKVDQVTLRDAPVTYLFDKKNPVDFFSMGIHLPGFLNWGDISLAAAMGGKDITFINPRTMSGEKINGNRLKEYKAEFDEVRRISRQAGETNLKSSLNEIIQ